MGLSTGAKAHCERLISFHQWRLEKICELLKDVDGQYYSQQISGSFSSLYIILKHLVWAEKIWLGRVDQDKVAAMREQDFSGLMDDWKATAAQWQACIAAAEDFEKPCEYFTTSGQKHENSLFEIVTHLIDHSTYHIGQMMNAVRGFGIDPVSTNYIHYLRANAS